MRAALPLHLEKHRETVLGHQLVGDKAVEHRRRAQASLARAWARTVGRALVGHEDVVDVLDQGRHSHGIDRFERNLRHLIA